MFTGELEVAMSTVGALLMISLVLFKVVSTRGKRRLFKSTGNMPEVGKHSMIQYVFAESSLRLMSNAPNHSDTVDLTFTFIRKLYGPSEFH